MRLASGLSILFAAGLALGATAAKAEEWALAGGNPAAVWEIDVSSIQVKQDVVKSWTRQTLSKPLRDEASHKFYVQELVLRTDDCTGRKFAFGTVVRRNQAGEVVGQVSGGTNWQDVVPGSVSESIWKTACAAAHPPRAEPLVADLRGGGWRSLGASNDNSYVEWISTDDIVKVEQGYVLIVSRSDYAQPQWKDGFAVRHVVRGYVVDCVNERAAIAGEDAYVAPGLRVTAYRIEPKELQLAPLSPASYMARYLKQICGSARPIDAGNKGRGEGDKGDDKVVTGTAWGVNKGYLVTAAHVIEGSTAIDVYRDGDKVGEAKVVVADFANDLAILSFTKHPGGKLKILPLSSGPATLGRAVFTLGYPAPELLGQGVKMTSGQVNSTSGMQDDTRMLQISIPIQGGNSGGPVLGWDASVVGVVDSKLLKLDEQGHEPPQNVNYAVKASYLRPMLDDLPDLGDYEAVKAGASQEQTVAAVREAVFMLLVAR